MRSRGFRVYVALNMLLLSVLTAGACYPRETISGWCGRNRHRSAMARVFGAGIDRLHFWEHGHCAHVARCEAEAFYHLEYKDKQ